MNKKTVLAISLVGTVVGFLITGLTMLKFWCGPNGYACWDRLEFVGNLLLIFLPAFVFSIITYFLREEVFRAWLRFAYWWIPVSLVFIYLAGGWSGGGFGIPAVLDQEFVSLILSGLFLLISLLLIAYKYFASRRSE